MTRLMTGLLLGVGIGILIAPDKGEDTRANLADTADKWREKFNKLVGKAEAKVEDLRGLLDKEITGLSEDVRNRILTILDEEEGTRTSAYDFKDEFRPI